MKLCFIEYNGFSNKAFFVSENHKEFRQFKIIPLNILPMLD